MAGSSNDVTSRTRTEVGRGAQSKSVEVVLVDFVADDTDASIPNLSIRLDGYCIKVVTNPGSTGPTDDYDIALGDPQDASLDALNDLLGDRSITATQQVYPVFTGGATPIWLNGVYTLSISNNAVNDATGAIQFYMVDSL